MRTIRQAVLEMTTRWAEASPQGTWSSRVNQRAITITDVCQGMSPADTISALAEYIEAMTLDTELLVRVGNEDPTFISRVLTAKQAEIATNTDRAFQQIVGPVDPK